MQEETPTEVELRSSSERPVFKLSVRLIDTYKYINKVYYEAKAQKIRDQKDAARGGVHNDGYDDQNYDYILCGDEIMNDRYIIKHKMGKGSFGQVVCAYDQERKIEVAIKIIKSRKPFLIQAKTEIDILNKVNEKDDGEEEANIVRLLDQFIYRNHQCLVFEILSFNLYELLKNTKFRGVSLSLIRKFSRHLLKALEFLSRPDVDIIHCDLKPENILLRHPRRSAIKLIDFGSSCYLSKRAYSYIQSRFYRSPEVLLGLPYNQKIDMWSLGCVCVEMHTGEPLFGGANQADQICRIVDILGMPPISMLKASPEKVRSQFFERVLTGADTSALPGVCDLTKTVQEEDGSAFFVLKRPNKEGPRARTLEEIIGVNTGGPAGRRAGEADHTPAKYTEFLDFVKRMLIYDPVERANPTDMLSHVYLAELIAQIAQIAVSNKNAAVAAASGVSKENSSAMEVASGEDAGATATETAGTTEGTKTRSQSAPSGCSSTVAQTSSNVPLTATGVATAAVATAIAQGSLVSTVVSSSEVAATPMSSVSSNVIASGVGGAVAQVTADMETC
mmetsp:Transcript_56298/g.110984  ORF Transcript_56298/g.110984 Transcript_56298/m.110984 type:complete len:561 (-) Transcript_56298:263-1945(-)